MISNEDNTMDVNMLEHLPLEPLSGERTVATMDLRENLDGDESNFLVLTDRRLIEHKRSKRQSNTAASFVEDLHTVKITTEQLGIAPYVWAGISIVVGLSLWQVIEHPIGSLAALVIMLLMGSYLFLDRFFKSRNKLLIVMSGSFEFRVVLTTELLKQEAHEFARNLTLVKDAQNKANTTRPFSPR